MNGIADPIVEEPLVPMSRRSRLGRRRRLTGALTAAAVAGFGLLSTSIHAPQAGAAPAHAALAPAAPGSTNPMVTLLPRGISKPAGMVVVNGSTTAVVDSGHNQVIATTFPSASSLFSALPFTGLRAPTGIAANGSTLDVADTGHNRVVELNGTTQTSLPFIGLQAPTGVAVDGAGDVWVADTGHNRILGLPAGAGSEVVEPFAGSPRRARWSPTARATSSRPTLATTGSSSWLPALRLRPFWSSLARRVRGLWPWARVIASSLPRRPRR
jgi:hypothetical protein